MQHRSWRRAGLAVAAIGLGLAAVVATAPAGAADKVTFTVGTDAGHRQPEPADRCPRHRLRGLEPRVRHADRQGGQGLLGHPRPGRVVEGQRRRPHRHLHAAGRASSGATASRITADDVAYTINRSRDEEWVNHVSTTANLDAKAHRRQDRRDHDLGPGSRSSRSWTSTSSPSTSGRSSTRRRRSEYDGPRRRGLRAVQGRRGQEGRVRPDGAQPQLARQAAGHGRGHLPDLLQRRGPVPGPEDGRDRRRRRGPGRDLHHPRPEGEHRAHPGQPGRLRRARR